MPIDVKDVSRAQAERLISQAEGHFFDVKAKEISPSKLTKTISAFANADGGELVIGADEDKALATKAWRGYSNEEEANAHIQVFETLFPLGHDFVYVFLRCDGLTGLLLQILVTRPVISRRRATELRTFVEGHRVFRSIVLKKSSGSNSTRA